tara:strand:+ start:556 stop:768 length:213 start_codon:yes stop_codon:yes gene_type:complete
MDNNNSHKYLPLNNYNNDNTYKLLVNVKKKLEILKCKEKNDKLLKKILKKRNIENDKKRDELFKKLKTLF